MCIRDSIYKQTTCVELDALNLRPCLNLQSSNALNRVGANSSTSQLREGTALLSSSRRTFLQSLSKSALVLSLDNVLALARPLRAQALHSAAEEPAKAVTGLGLSFINVARESGLNAKTIYGGEHKNKYLLETTGCGVAFYDYDNDGWLDIFLSLIHISEPTRLLSISYAVFC